VPLSFSYAPTFPKVLPPKVGLSLGAVEFVGGLMTILVIPVVTGAVVVLEVVEPSKEESFVKHHF
jgi:hypothetical protein